MEDIFVKLVNMSITASWLVLAILAVRLVFRKAPKWIFCLLWGMVALRLLCPWSLESGLSLIPSTQPLKQDIVFTPPPQQARGEILNSMGSVVLEQTLTAPARGEILDADGNVVLEKDLNPNSADPEQIWLFVLSRVWGLGMGLMLLYALISYLLLYRRVATAIPIGKNIKRSEFVDTPFVLGLFRPVIYIPACMEPGDIPYVVAHEQAHIRRRDHWWKPLGFALLSIYWFNPVLWAAYIFLCRDIEAACDEKVIGTMSLEERRAYSTALLHCSIHRRRIAACPLAFGEVGVKERVKSVMNYKKPAFWVVLIAVIVSVVVAVCFLTNPASSQPVIMQLDYVNRKGAFLKFRAQTEEEYRISPDYWLEVLDGGNWQELTRLSEEQPAGEVAEAALEDADFDAWSNLKWEDSYGTLGDGTYRIRKDITIKDDSPYSAYAQFIVGGTAEEYVTYTLEDLIPTGAKLYEQENTNNSEQLVYNGDEGFWLEKWQDGQWQFLEPPENRKPALKQDRHFIQARQYLSGYLELDWSALYGQLANGTYRIAREVTNTAEGDFRVCTAYAEFTLDRRVITWFDRDSANPEEQYPRETVMELPGMAGASVSYDESKDEIRLTTAEGTQTVISSPFMMQGIFLTDLTGDDIWEICATIRTEETMQVQVYDAAENRLYTLPAPENGIYVLTAKADRLCVLEKDENWNLVDYGQLGLSDGALVVRQIGPELRALTEQVVCVDIWTNKQVCLSSGEKREEILALLHALQNGVEPASQREVDAARSRGDAFRISRITVQYELGQRNLVFSRDFSILWEENAGQGYRVRDPKPLRDFVNAVTDGVRGKTAVGEPFAAMDAPWDWCAGIHSKAVESAQVHVCLYAYSYGNTSGSSSTNGAISYDTLEELIAILNRLPKDALTPEKVMKGRTYRSILNNQQVENTSVGIVDGVNNLGMVLNYQDGKVSLLLTDEMEKVKSKKETYLNPTQMWLVQDPALTDFMERITEDPPVITYFVGSEYEWQEPLEISLGDSSVSLRLIEGWEYERVTNPTDSGIRCRPAGVTEGWLYFSFWPEGYHPVEENRLILEGGFWNWKTFTSYSDEAGTPNNFDVTDAVWSYRRTELESGDYVVINEGADSWFRDYRDQIDDTMMLTQIPGAED